MNICAFALQTTAPETRFREQLEQLTAMGFSDRERNLQGKK